MTRIRCRHPRAAAVAGTILAGLVAAACGSGGPAEIRSAPASTTLDVSSTTLGSMSTTPPSPASTESPTTAGSAVATEPPAATTVPAARAVPAALDRAGDAGQAMIVTADAYGATTATLSTWQRAAGGWEQVHGPWTAFVGYAGFAPPGEKREGDGRTPSGTYGFDFLFGIEPDPGVSLPYRRVTGPSIVWDDVPSSPSYNQWVDGGAGEAMYQSPVYDYAAVIAYNTAARTPGLGSAIFLHVSRGNPTAGCVSLPVDRLLEVLRWLDPGRAPVIVMGVA